jgi:hypothetical protein
MPEFTHAGINERIAGLSLLPGMKKFRVWSPWELLKFHPQGLMCHMGKMSEQVSAKLPPHELSSKRHQAGFGPSGRVPTGGTI